MERICTVTSGAELGDIPHQAGVVRMCSIALVVWGGGGTARDQGVLLYETGARRVFRGKEVIVNSVCVLCLRRFPEDTQFLDMQHE